jgi:NAD(P)-dependent dehydrogenase (short-subunit alcohol dehydrogenase family)
MKLDNSIAAIVTGAASGLGEATARALAERGVKVALFDRDAEKGEAVAASIGGVFAQVDVTSDEAVAAGFAKAREAHGQERICVNCAGVANAAKTVGRDKATGEARGYPIQQFELAIQINLIGTFRVLRPVRARHGVARPARGRRTRPHHQHRLGGGAGRPDRPGRLQRLQGRSARNGAPHRPRPDERGASGSTPSCPESSRLRWWR